MEHRGGSWGSKRAGCAVPHPSLPFFLGPLHTTASSGLSSRKPTDMREMLCSWSTKTGTQPLSHWCTALPCARSMRGMLGPHRSTSRMPTCKEAGRPRGAGAAGQSVQAPGWGAHLLARVAQGQGQLRGDGAFPDPPLSREDEEDVPDTCQVSRLWSGEKGRRTENPPHTRCSGRLTPKAHQPLLRPQFQDLLLWRNGSKHSPAGRSSAGRPQT